RRRGRGKYGNVCSIPPTPRARRWPAPMGSSTSCRAAPWPSYGSEPSRKKYRNSGQLPPQRQSNCMEASQYKAQQWHGSDLRHHRRLPVGADVLPSGGVHFRVWASRRQHVEVVLEGGPGHHPGAEPIAFALAPEGDGYFSGLVPEASAGTLYHYRLDGGTESYPDAASRFQPHGPHGPSQVIDPGAFQWHDQGWRGVSLEGQVIYEMHVGTFTPASTWEAAMGELPVLAELGVTVLEIMPIADFPGRFGWGYDGVNLFAPTRLYGTPDDCRRFIDRAHTLELGVILDVVYN